MRNELWKQIQILELDEDIIIGDLDSLCDLEIEQCLSLISELTKDYDHYMLVNFNKKLDVITENIVEHDNLLDYLKEVKEYLNEDYMGTGEIIEDFISESFCIDPYDYKCEEDYDNAVSQYADNYKSLDSECGRFVYVFNG